MRSGGHGFSGVGRQAMLTLLQRRCAALGVVLRFEHEIDPTSRRSSRASASTWSSRRTASTAASASATPAPSGRHRPPPLPLHLARHAAPVRCLHLRFRRDGARLVPGARVPVRRGDEHLHRRDAVRGVGEGRTRSRMSAEESIAYCERLFARTLDGAPLLSNARHLRGSASWIRFPRVTCESLGALDLTDARPRRRARGAARRRGAHRALLHRVGEQARARGCDRPRPDPRRRRGHHAPRARAQYQAERSVEVLKLHQRGAQLHGVVRVTSRATPRSRRSSSPTRCSRARSASRTRTCASATPSTCAPSSGGSRSAPRRTRRRRRPPRPMPRTRSAGQARGSPGPAVADPVQACAASRSPTASSSRPWRSTARTKTARRATGTWCISARARPVARAS
jgi:hypothetical protein